MSITPNDDLQDTNTHTHIVHHTKAGSVAAYAVISFLIRPKGSRNKSVFGEALKNPLDSRGMRVKTPDLTVFTLHNGTWNSVDGAALVTLGGT